MSETDEAAFKPNAKQEVVAIRAKEALGTPTKETATGEMGTQCPGSRRLISL